MRYFIEARLRLDFLKADMLSGTDTTLMSGYTLYLWLRWLVCVMLVMLSLLSSSLRLRLEQQLSRSDTLFSTYFITPPINNIYQ